MLLRGDWEVCVENEVVWFVIYRLQESFELMLSCRGLDTIVFFARLGYTIIVVY